MNGVANLALRLALCAAATWALWRMLGLATLVVCAPAYAMALRGPLYDLFAAAGRKSREIALAPVQGRYFAHLDVNRIDQRDRILAPRIVAATKDGV